MYWGLYLHGDVLCIGVVFANVVVSQRLFLCIGDGLRDVVVS